VLFGEQPIHERFWTDHFQFGERLMYFGPTISEILFVEHRSVKNLGATKLTCTGPIKTDTVGFNRASLATAELRRSKFLAIRIDHLQILKST